MTSSSIPFLGSFCFAAIFCYTIFKGIQTWTDLWSTHLFFQNASIDAWTHELIGSCFIYHLSHDSHGFFIHPYHWATAMSGAGSRWGMEFVSATVDGETHGSFNGNFHLISKCLARFLEYLARYSIVSIVVILWTRKSWTCQHFHPAMMGGEKNSPVHERRSKRWQEAETQTRCDCPTVCGPTQFQQPTQIQQLRFNNQTANSLLKRYHFNNKNQICQGL